MGCSFTPDVLFITRRYGCIPVIATDMLYEAFEPELDWSHFGVRVSQRDIPKLGDLLDNFSEKELLQKQVRREHKVAPHLWCF